MNVFRFEMEGFDKMDGQEFMPITLEKYVSKVQESKRDIALSTFSTFEKVDPN